MSKGTLKRLLDRATETEKGGGQIKRRRMKFTIDPEVCEKGMFDAPIEVVMTAPSAAMEHAAAKKAEQDPIIMTRELVKICIESVDGDPVKRSDLTRDVFWEALGVNGRALLQKTFIENLTPHIGRASADGEGDGEGGAEKKSLMAPVVSWI